MAGLLAAAADDDVLVTSNCWERAKGAAAKAMAGGVPIVMDPTRRSKLVQDHILWSNGKILKTNDRSKGCQVWQPCVLMCINERMRRFTVGHSQQSNQQCDFDDTEKKIDWHQNLKF